MACWLILEKSDKTRISQGIDSYSDKTGEEYHYDSLVPNHKSLGSGDVVVVRKDDKIIGLGEVGDINKSQDIKTHRRCPNQDCNSTDIRERIKKTPKWKCGSCAYEFANPVVTQTDVMSYVASIENFQILDNPPSVQEIKKCSLTPDGLKAQLSILPLNEKALHEKLGFPMSTKTNVNQVGFSDGQGFGLSQPQRKAVELRAMQVAISKYKELGWVIEDMSSTQSYDLLAIKNNEKRFIEVKGTTGNGDSVLLTNGELQHARNNTGYSVLIVISGIILQRDGKDWIASGGNIRYHQDPWNPEDDVLEPTQFRYFIKNR